jgi:hypothetical protein
LKKAEAKSRGRQFERFAQTAYQRLKPKAFALHEADNLYQFMRLSSRFIELLPAACGSRMAALFLIKPGDGRITIKPMMKNSTLPLSLWKEARTLRQPFGARAVAGVPR